MDALADPDPAPLFLHRDAEQPQLAQLRPKLPRKGVAAVDLVRHRGNVVGGEAAHRIAQHVDCVAEVEIEGGIGVGNHLKSSYSACQSYSRPIHLATPCGDDKASRA